LYMEVFFARKLEWHETKKYHNAFTENPFKVSSTAGIGYAFWAYIICMLFQ
jgi:hypothetical protein